MNRITLCLKKGLQIGMMGAALATSPVLMAGCSTGSDGNETEIEQGGNQNDNFFDQYNTPKVKNIGNGFALYQPMGEGGNLGGQGVTAANKYLDKASQHVQGLINDFEASLANRPAAKNYFNSFTNGLKSNGYFHMNETRPGGTEFDNQINNYSKTFHSPLTAIAQNVDRNDRNYFKLVYEFLLNEAHNEGFGAAKNQADYKRKRDTVIEVWKQFGYDQSTGVQMDVNHLPQITGLMNQYLGRAANKIGQGVTAGDLRQVMNLSFMAQALKGTHDYSKNADSINHTNCYILEKNVNFNRVIVLAIESAIEAEQNNEQTMSY